MVFFTCNSCSASLKKKDVEKHYMQRCRSCESLTCVDCLKDFVGDEYKNHISCVSEKERYGGKDYKEKANENKGLKKQMQWIENLNELMQTQTDIEKDVRDVLNLVVEHDNVPRKRPKFVNFIKNIRKGLKPNTIEKTWKVMERAFKSPQQQQNPPLENVSIVSKNSDTQTNCDVHDDKERKATTTHETINNGDMNDEPNDNASLLNSMLPKAKENKKPKKVPMGDENSSLSPQVKQLQVASGPKSKQSLFSWEECIRCIVEVKMGSKKGGVKLKRLKKAVIAEYLTVMGEENFKSEDELSAKFDKKMKKLTTKVYKLSNDVVQLKTPR